MREQRLRCVELERQLNEKKTEIIKSSVEVDHNLSNDLTTILSETQQNITPFYESVLAAAKVVTPK